MYLFLSPVNNRALRRVADSLQYGCLACICPSDDKDSELDLWNWTTELGVHWSSGCRSINRSQAHPGEVELVVI